MSVYLLIIFNFLLLFKAMMGILRNSDSIFAVFWGCLICLILASLVGVKEDEYLKEQCEKKIRNTMLLGFGIVVIFIFI